MWSGFVDRLVRAATLDGSLFREVAEDAQATGPALAVVLGAGLAEGVGRLASEGLAGFFSGVGRGCLAWSFWFAGIHLLAWAAGLRVELATLFRALGFAAVPFTLAVLEVVPVLGVLAWLVKWVLGFAVFTTAVRAVITQDTGRALLLCGGGLIVALLLSIPVGRLFGSG